MKMTLLEQLVESQLNLQVKLSYREHHDFILRHGLRECRRVLDIGTGNGSFVARLAQDHPGIQYVGIDKRKSCIESCEKNAAQNLSFAQVDMFGRDIVFDFSAFDGFLIRYFLLHVDHSKKILELLKEKSKRPSRFWIIDLDFSQFSCVPPHPAFDKLTGLVEEFCSKTSVDSLAGKRILPLLKDSGYQNTKVENIPFSTQTMSIDDLALYLIQEVLCYSMMCGGSMNDPRTLEIVSFLEGELKMGKHQISYGMILISAQLGSP